MDEVINLIILFIAISFHTLMDEEKTNNRL